jgi:hypothetical protein
VLFPEILLSSLPSAWRFKKNQLLLEPWRKCLMTDCLNVLLRQSLIE